MDDRDKVRAFMVDKSSRCTMCGTGNWEWEANRFAYEPVVEVCIGCQQKDLAREDATQAGASIVLLPPDQAAKMRARPKIGPRSRRSG